MLRGHSTFGFGFGLASPRRSSCARWGDVGCAVSVKACPSLVVRGPGRQDGVCRLGEVGGARGVR
jgi:hypothetical protein